MLSVIHHKARDNARTPMQWDASAHGGFTSGTPWLKVNPNYVDINVKNALDDPNSIFYYYQKLIRLRKEHPVIVYGDYTLLAKDDERIWAYLRRLEQEGLLVILNFSVEQVEFLVPEELHDSPATILISNYDVSQPDKLGQIFLKPYEARVYKIGF